MSSFFNVEGPLFSTLDKIADLFWLNILFIICCLPIFTIGASSTALYYVTLKMVKNEEGGITKSFFRAFKSNFRQSTVIWLLAMLFGGILIGDYMIMSENWGDINSVPDVARKALRVILLMAGFCYVFTLRYVFPLLSRFDNSIRNTIKNAFLISIRHLPYSVLLIAIAAVATILVYFVPRLRVICFIIFFSGIAFLSSYIFVKIFAYYMPPEEETNPDSFLPDGEQTEQEEKQE